MIGSHRLSHMMHFVLTNHNAVNPKRKMATVSKALPKACASDSKQQKRLAIVVDDRGHERRGCQGHSLSRCQRHATTAGVQAHPRPHFLTLVPRGRFRFFTTMCNDCQYRSISAALNSDPSCTNSWPMEQTCACRRHSLCFVDAHGTARRTFCQSQAGASFSL